MATKPMTYKSIKLRGTKEKSAIGIDTRKKLWVRRRKPWTATANRFRGVGYSSSSGP